jgi:hypothetical protein
MQTGPLKFRSSYGMLWIIQMREGVVQLALTFVYNEGGSAARVKPRGVPGE